MFGRKKEESELSFDLSKFEKKDQSEIERIKQILEASEIIKTVARQSRIMPGKTVKFATQGGTYNNMKHTAMQSQFRS